MNGISKYPGIHSSGAMIFQMRCINISLNDWMPLQASCHFSSWTMIASNTGQTLSCIVMSNIFDSIKHFKVWGFKYSANNYR